MKNRRHAGCFAVLLWLTVLGTSQLAAADAKDEARILFEAGVTASRAERWNEASEYFQRSLSLSEKPSTWFNLAVAEVKLGRGAEALRALDAFEQMASRPDHADMLERAVALRAQAAALRQQEPSARSSAVSEAETQQGAQIAAPPFPSQTQVADTTRNAGPELLLGAGAVSALGAIGAGLWWHDRAHASDRCASSAATCLNGEQIDRQRRAAIGVTATLTLAAVGLVVGGATLLMRKRKNHAGMWLDVGPRHGSVSLRWSF